MKKIVASKYDLRANLKAIATLIGGIATALVALYGPETGIGQVLPVVIIVAGAIVTWAVPNAEVAPIGDNPSGQEYEDGFDPDDATEDGEPYDYPDSDAALAAADEGYVPQHRGETEDSEPVTWADEAPQVEGDVEEDPDAPEADTPLPVVYHEGGPDYATDSPDQRLS